MVHSSDTGPDPEILFEFSRPDAATGWYDINDVVMGGISWGKAIWKDKGCLVFKGNVSFENNGGFSLIRSANTDYDLQDYKGVKIKVRGDGKKYKFTLRTVGNLAGGGLICCCHRPRG